MLWEKLIAHFTLLVFDDDEAKTKSMRDLVKHFALKKMAEQFNNYKNAKMSKIRKLQISLAH